MVIALALAAALVAQTSTPKQTSAPTVSASAAATAPRDACALLTNDEVGAVLGVQVKERRPGRQQAQGLLLRQCYFGTATARSISLAVTGNMRVGDKTTTPREYWREQFHPSDKEKAARGEGEREGALGARPVPGLGDEAFWSGTRIAGALYVLRGRTFLRISVGGIQDEQERIEKSKALARAALKRL